jgi:hypothetical protein
MEPLFSLSDISLLPDGVLLDRIEDCRDFLDLLSHHSDDFLGALRDEVRAELVRLEAEWERRYPPSAPS